MLLTTETIEQRIGAASSMTRDNVAQDIINAASIAELTGIEPKGIFILLDALDGGWKSARDKKARHRLKNHSRFRSGSMSLANAIEVIKRSPAVTTNSVVQTELTSSLIDRLYAAEGSRLSLWERIGIDGKTVGRGQLGDPAFRDVISPPTQGFGNAWLAYLEEYCAMRLLNDQPIPAFINFHPTYSFSPPTTYTNVYKHEILEDFVVAAYLAIRIKAASKPMRSIKDTVRFAVARYHGMYTMVREAQVATNNDVEWSPVEENLRSNGFSDESDYVNEVVE